jgi:hypothetical protein
VAFGVLDRVLGSTIGFIGDATRAFIEDEQSIERLSAALKGSIPNWTGSTAAIEATLKARMRLGFTDDDQRNSLVSLLAATGDVTEALRVQRVAMDLARLKNIDLASAADALTKVEAGSYRILKSLGIELADGATQMEALAAVERVATDQAEKYANTTGGKMLAAQVKIGESTERLGQSFAQLGSVALPIAADGFELVIDAAGRLGDLFGTLGKLVPSGNLLRPITPPWEQPGWAPTPSPTPSPTPDLKFPLNVTVNATISAASVTSATTTYQRYASNTRVLAD